MDYSMDISEDLKQTECSHTAERAKTYVATASEIVKTFLLKLQNTMSKNKYNSERAENIKSMIDDVNNMVDALEDIGSGLDMMKEECFRDRI